MHTPRRFWLVAASSLALLSGAALPALAHGLPTVTAEASQATAPSKPWAQIASDIPVDESVRFGTLPNGMRYAIKKNATPPGQASLRLRIAAGSLMETEEQLGLAHFTEHMAFNGTTNVPENDLLRILERLGLAFGADTNAFTSFEQTAYVLELPRTNDETVDTSLMILREQVSEALMDGAAIDAEREVIAGEERLRNTPSLRSLKAQIELLAPGQLLSKRLPIGDLSIIRSAPRDRFVEFYQSYYRPSRATLVAVGDFDIDQMEAKIKARFSDWQPKAPDGPEPDLGKVAAREAETRILIEPGVQSSVQINWIREPDTSPDTVAYRNEQSLRNLGLSVLNLRLGELARADNPPFIGAGSYQGSLFDSLDMATVAASFNPGGIKRALETIEQEQRRLLEHGISQDELERVLTNLRTALQNSVATSATRNTPSLANGLLSAANDDEVFTSPQTSLELFEAFAPSVTTDSVNAAIKRALDGQGPLVLVITPEAIEGGEEAVTAIVEASRQVAVSAPTVQAKLDWPYADFGTPSQPTETKSVEAVGATVTTFPNGVRLIVKPTNFKDDQILISVQTGIGERNLPSDRFSAQSLAPAIYAAGGLGKLTLDELNRVLTGKIYGIDFNLNDESYSFTGATRPEDLQLQMQVLAAYLTDPGLRPAPLQQIKGFFPQIIAQQMATPAGAFSLQAASLLAGGDKRPGTPSVEDIAAVTIEELSAQLKQGLSNGPIDIVVVGDVTLEDAIASVSSTFGALPQRPAPAEPVPGAEQRSFPAGTPTPLRFTHTGQADQSYAFIAWPTTDAVDDRTEARRVSILEAVVNLRVLDEIREKQALAYSPSVNARASNTYRGYGMLSIGADTPPEKFGAFYAAVEAIAEDLKTKPITEDELNRARLPVLEQLRRSQAGNEFWLGQLDELAAKPESVEQVTTLISDMEAVTVADIQQLAQTYLKSDKAWKAEVVAASAQ